MTNDEFSAQFDADELAAIENEMAEAAAQHEAETVKAQPVKDGLWYVEDTTDGNGHTISWYRLVMAGKTVLWISADNDLEATPEQLGGVLPGGATGHFLTVHNSTRTASIATKGFGVRVPHGDGTGSHIDGQTVRSYVTSRALRWIGEFYGV